MQTKRVERFWLRATGPMFLVLLALFASSVRGAALDVTRPGDPIVGSSENTQFGEGVTNAIDDEGSTKYLNFDRLNTGFTVTPSAGYTVLGGLTLLSANDSPERDPASFTLEGTNDGVNFTPIEAGPVPAFSSRFELQTIDFMNSTPFRGYSMQIAEVELLGRRIGALTDLTRPGDVIIGSSENTQFGEGVTNAIDDQGSTKYLNFDRLNTGFTVTPAAHPAVVRGLTLTSANDSTERDPSSYVLEGSTNGVDFAPIASGAVPQFQTRFQTQTLTFDNTLPYLSYRVRFPTVAGPGGSSMQIAEVELLHHDPNVNFQGLRNVLRADDAVLASSPNSPGGEGVENAIDDDLFTKYLNFDELDAGLTVTPGVGRTLVRGLGVSAANDAPERDPLSFRLEGSNDNEAFSLIAEGVFDLFAHRFDHQETDFANTQSYLHYRLTFPTVADSEIANSMQLADIQLFGLLLGDMNGDSAVDNEDISPFVQALVDPDAYQAAYPLVAFPATGDISGDGLLDNEDIAPFVTLLLSGGQPAQVPEPATTVLLVLGGTLLPLGLRRGTGGLLPFVSSKTFNRAGSQASHLATP
jgi:hypothetical protein